jgi:RNA polymerase sigma factor (sigma-70 family)
LFLQSAPERPNLSFRMTSSPVLGEDQGAAAFQTTHWTVVLAAFQENSSGRAEALAQLCSAYRSPLYVFIRRRGYPPEDADDLVQGFFLHLLNGNLRELKREGGRFRSYLLRALKCFLVNDWRRQNAQKRGGGAIIVPADSVDEQRYQSAFIEDSTPETMYEQQWALSLMDRTVARLREEYAAVKKDALFEQLQSFLPGLDRGLRYPEAAASLGMSEAAVRVAVHRLRRRYGELLRAEIGKTVSSPAEIDDEIRHLIEVMGRK